MQRFIFVVLAVVIFLQGCLTTPAHLSTDQISLGRITENHDRFEKSVYLKLEDMVIKRTSHGYNNGLKLTAYITTDLAGIRKDSRPSIVGLSIMSQSIDWKYLKCHNTILLSNGSKVRIHKIKHDGTVGSDYVLKFITLTLKSSEFLKMANATTLEGRICGDEFSFTHEQIGQLRKLATMAKLNH